MALVGGGIRKKGEMFLFVVVSFALLVYSGRPRSFVSHSLRFCLLCATIFSCQFGLVVEHLAKSLQGGESVSLAMKGIFQCVCVCVLVCVCVCVCVVVVVWGGSDITFVSSLD